MTDNTKHLEAGWKKRSEEAREKAFKAIEKIKRCKGSVNFNSVHVESGLSKNYLYKNEEIRAAIIEERDVEQARTEACHKKYDKTSKSKDVIIAAKDKRITKLEEENKKLKKEIANLMALLYKK